MKPFVATAIILLKKDGKLNLNDPIGKFIPELNFYKDITIKNLLNHTSGLPDYMDMMEEYWDKSKIATNEDVIQLMSIQKPKVLFAPNEKHEYSNTGYMLLATIIERITGKQLNDYLQQKIFKPLGMENTFIYQRRKHPREIENMTVGYAYSDSLQRKITPDEFGKDFFIVYLDGVYGDGKLFSNVEDMLKWDRALYADKILSEVDRKEMFSNHITKDKDSTNYGYGWQLENDKKYGKIVKHSGRWGGYLNYFERDIDNDKTIIILQNVETDQTIIPIKRIRAILYDEIAKVSIEKLKQYAGNYKTSSGKIKTIYLNNNTLQVPLPFDKNTMIDLMPVSETEFVVDGFSPPVKYKFLTDSSNKVIGYLIEQNGKEIRAEKIDSP